MSPWLFRIWRFGFARDKYSVIGGYKRLLWRLWWDLRLREPDGRWVTHTLDTRALNPPTTPLHWRPAGWQYTGHFCGAEPAQPWTVVLASATCIQCRLRAEPVQIQYSLNNR